MKQAKLNLFYSLGPGIALDDVLTSLLPCIVASFTYRYL